MGGIDTDADGKTSINGFYATGECACVSVHGANRLGGNSLLETIVFGARAGRKAAQESLAAKDKDSFDNNICVKILKQTETEIQQLCDSRGNENPYKIKKN